MHHLRRPLLALFACLWFGLDPASARPQYRDDDDRDRLVLSTGREERGRLVWQYDPDGDIHWMTPRGKLRRFDAEKVVQLDTVSKRLGAWLSARSPRASLDQEWALVQVAIDSGLDAMAKAQALHLLSRDPTDVRAHEFLGHSKKGERWMWTFGDENKPLTFEDWEARGMDPGHPLVLEGEHFVLYTTAGLGRSVDLLFDLETTYREFHAEFFGVNGLRPYEMVRRRIDVRVYGDEEQFPALTGAKRGYYLPGLALAPSDETPFSGSGNEIQTYYSGQGTHPVQFFELAAQALLYNCILGERSSVWDSGAYGFYREAASIEVGFANWFGRQFQGRPGFVERRPFRLDSEDALIARERADVFPLRDQRKELPNLLGLNYEFFHRNDEATRREYEARAHSFVAYLMDARNVFPEGRKEGESTRNALVEYLRSVYLSGSGSSSSKFDEALGVKVEKLTEHYKEWLTQF